MNLVAVGSVALDTIETPKGRVVLGLGGSATHFSLAASLFVPVHIVGVIGDDFPEKNIMMLHDHNIDTDGVKRVPGKTFHWSGVYGKDFGDPKTLLTELGVFETFSPQLPDYYLKHQILFLGNIAPSLQLEVIEKMDSPKLIAADTMNFWIDSACDDLKKVIKKVNLLIINELEVRMLSGMDNVTKGAQEVLKMGPDVLIMKRGASGASLISKDDYFSIPAFPVDEVVDPTGAGDSFAGGMMGYLGMTEKFDIASMRTAMAYGTITASFEVEKFCTDGLEAMTKEAHMDRVKKLYNMTQFSI